MMSLKTNIDSVKGFVSGFHAVGLLSFGFKNGLFKRIKNFSRFSALEFGKINHISFSTATSFLAAASSIGIFNVEKSKYSFKGHFREMFTDESSPNFVGNYLNIHIALENCFKASGSKMAGKHPHWNKNTGLLNAMASDSKRIGSIIINNVISKTPAIAAKLKKNGTVLDVGCGCGTNIFQFQKMFPTSRFIGIDIDSASLRIARQLNSSNKFKNYIRFIRTCASNISAKYGYIDLILMLNTLHEIKKELHQIIFSNCYRIMLSQSAMIVMEPLKTKGVNSTNNDITSPAIHQWLEIGHAANLLTKSEMIKLICNAGFKKIYLFSSVDTMFQAIITKN